MMQIRSTVGRDILPMRGRCRLDKRVDGTVDSGGGLRMQGGGALSGDLNHMINQRRDVAVSLDIVNKEITLKG